ncbi:hypothetical protein [Pseudaestuariivita atlantica]|uniref:Uncharacterized protein n=1 Tax=Pseudaestuariivita atlantica TaxID=1317121 RepID=A0A0L1JL66_9RHOB|nr:hypothetical protein [Pseudaestuariivita atlantica]KNG92490.1 hypothetical protein ATO11_17975 [Pseudaestuariivita atlantica]
MVDIWTALSVPVSVPDHVKMQYIYLDWWMDNHLVLYAVGLLAGALIGWVILRGTYAMLFGLRARRMDRRDPKLVYTSRNIV